jgi:hypothetical protein
VHSIGITDCYYKPTEKEILDGYLNAIDALNVNKNSKASRKRK